MNYWKWFAIVAAAVATWLFMRCKKRALYDLQNMVPEDIGDPFGLGDSPSGEPRMTTMRSGRGTALVN